MKRHLLAASIVLALITPPAMAGWFDNDKQEKEQLQQELTDQRRDTGAWQIIAGGLAVITVAAFTVGTVLGSRTRRKLEQPHGPQQ